MSIKYIYLLVLLNMIIACKKDLGNYEYSAVDSLTISEIEDSYIKQTGAHIKINPEFNFSSGEKFIAEEYVFEWKAYDAKANKEPWVISNNQNLDQLIPMGIGEYMIYFTVKQKVTGLLWKKKIKLQVQSGYNGGWMVLIDDNGKSRLDFFEYDHQSGGYSKVHRNFQEMIRDENYNPIALAGKPTFICGWENQTESTGSGNKYFVYIGTTKGTEKINLTDGFIWNDKYAFKYETSSPALFETIDALLPTDSRDGYARIGSDVYKQYSAWSVLFGTPINRLDDGSYVKVAPQLAVFRFFMPAILMFDPIKKRFIRNSGTDAISASPLHFDQNNSAFNPNDIGMDLVWMNQTDANGGQAYAVFSKNNRFYLARMDNNYNAFSARAWDEITTAIEIGAATRFEVDQRFGYLQYVVGSKIYQYDPSEKKTTLMQDYGKREITQMKYVRSAGLSYSTIMMPRNVETLGKRFVPLTTGLIVATYDPAQPLTSGKVDVWEVPQFNAPFKSFYTFEGFGKVVDVTEAEKPYGW